MALPTETKTTAVGPNDEASPNHSPAGKKWGVTAVICLIIAAGAIWWLRDHKAAKEKQTASGARAEIPATPVIAGVVAKKDVPIYLDGLGTVQAFNTVTVRARVDGQVVKIAFTEGQEVHVGDVLAEIDPDPYRAALEQTIAKKGQDEAQLANAKADLARYADLLANEGVTKQVFDTQKSLVNQLEASVKADQAAVESEKVQLGYTTIVSPIDGRAGIRLVDQGNIVRANDATGLVVLTQLKPISVVFTLPEQSLSKIQKKGAPAADLPVFALARDNTNTLAEGRLAVIDNQIDTSTGTIKLKATFANTDLQLWPGQFVNVRLRLAVRQHSAVVPASVVQRGPEGAFAFVIKTDQTVEIRPIKVAQIDQGEALIEEGLQVGETVVVDGQYKLQKGSRVRVGDAKRSGQNSPGSAAHAGSATNADGSQAHSKPAQP